MTIGVTDQGDWEVETLRLTAFINEVPRPEDITWWNDLFGEEAESTVSKPKQGKRKDEDIFEGGKLVLSCLPNRIDWLYTWKPEGETEGLPTIGLFKDYMQKFVSKMIDWFAMSPPINRLAFGVILLKPVESREEGYAIVNSLLPNVEIDTQDSLDFSYQINRPRTSNVITDKKLIINRLSKWSILRYHGFQITIGSGGVSSTSTGIPDDAEYVCRLELDISTDQESKEELPSDKLSSLFSEFVELGKEVMVHGDIK